jgi:mono/diheme cytochrome c family protein
MARQNLEPRYAQRGAVLTGFIVGAFILMGLGVVVLLLLQLEARGGEGDIRSDILYSVDPDAPVDAAELFSMACAICHGPNGEGDGPAAILMEPKPRAFVVYDPTPEEEKAGKLKIESPFGFVSSENGKPFKEDIAKTIRNGIPGTSMPSWSHFTDEQVDALADHVLGLWKTSFEYVIRNPQGDKKPPKEKVVEKILKVKTKPKNQLVDVPARPEVISEAARTRAHQFYVDNCAKCHGESGRGDGSQLDDHVNAYGIPPRDFSGGVFKGGSSGREIYTRIYAGIPHAGMPGFAGILKPDEHWALVDYVKSFIGQADDAEAGENK